MSEIPKDIERRAEEIAAGLGPMGDDGFELSESQISGAIADACFAERQATEKKLADLLKDPAAVRLNWMRGDIALDNIIDEKLQVDRHRCACVSRDFLIDRIGHDLADELSALLLTGDAYEAPKG